MKVVVTALHNPMPRKFFAEVERDGKSERWPISREDARRIWDEIRWLRQEAEMRPGSMTKPLPALGPLAIDLPEPSPEQIAEALTMEAQGVIVYVAESGMYDSLYIEGVYASAEAAMAANPVSGSAQARWPEAGWKEVGKGQWSNGCDFDAHCSVAPYEVQA